jgi:hypothetical protein
MKLGDRSLGISPQIWAVLEVLAGGDYGFYGLIPEVTLKLKEFRSDSENILERREKNHDVFTYPFYNFSGRAYGFVFVVKSFADITKPVLNFTITEAGGGDDICVIDWLSDRDLSRTPPMTSESRPEESRMATFRFGQTGDVLEYVRTLVAYYLIGKPETPFRTNGVIGISERGKVVV